MRQASMWEPWFQHGKVVSIEGTEVDGTYVVDAVVQAPAPLPDQIALRLVAEEPEPEPWYDTVLSMRASVGKLA